jgi:hypothetical protein
MKLLQKLPIVLLGATVVLAFKQADEIATV